MESYDGFSLTVEQADVDRAIEIRDAINDPLVIEKDICRLCIIYQALKRQGHQVRFVGLTFAQFKTDDGIQTYQAIAVDKMLNLTYLNPEQWELAQVPVTLTLERRGY